ncbi:uncharacterized protein LOC134844666 [Symsagittifera roscoffensis]|uniref:uncharacterized protein LOC134844666 n=1 Tax=Symsagittifera roscoffensis TaxID=84072 RepID=UPI00307BB40F
MGYLAAFWRLGTVVLSTSFVAGIVLVGLAGLYLGPKCVNNPGKPHSICVLVRSSQVGGALIALGVTISGVFALICAIEIQTRYFPTRNPSKIINEKYASRLHEIKEELSSRRSSQAQTLLHSQLSSAPENRNCSASRQISSELTSSQCFLDYHSSVVSI